MFHLARAIAKDNAGGVPLRTVWTTLEDATASFRRGQLVMVASGPGVGKSVLALTLAIQSKAKTLYFSADSGPGTQLARAASIVLGIPHDEAQKRIESGYHFAEELKVLNHIRMDYDAGPSLESIEEKVNAYAFLHGEYPELIAVDNLINVVGEGEEDHRSQAETLLFLLELARTTGATVVVLHHLTGEYEDGDKAPPLSSLLNKVGKIPEMVLTLWQTMSMGKPMLGVSIVKNRGGRADASGRYYVKLTRELSHMSITDVVSEGTPQVAHWRRVEQENMHG